MYASSACGTAPARVHPAASTANAASPPPGKTQRPTASGGRRAWGQALQKADQKKRWQQLLEHLPENMRQIWHALGGQKNGRLDDLWRLLDTYGGQTIRVPAVLPADRHHPLCRRLGKRCAAKLVTAFGGTPLYVPRCSSVLTKLRQQEIIETFSRHTAQGKSSTAAVSCLARRHGLSDRQVWKILKKVASAPAQGYLLHEFKEMGPQKENQDNHLQ
ncbi:Mor transcription activator family protein [Desulfovibrio sp. 86]|uniref:Mor transcription activator domain protein n=1 Tax=uncultured Desulfovibrio sp. TaxID=167968 RepID=A0A212L8S0_9BACT|nr:Mor transcription activator family protein [Desulfovibrio sp. 86]SCM73973.1 Mor transcription activator domain protein [uncultured Desulfovibrio sp.]VZH34561.1 Mor transcription activator domain protein [Desulfovibrio sp. 86]